MSGGLEPLFSAMVHTPHATTSPLALDPPFNYPTPGLPRTSEAARKVDSLRSALENLPPGASLEAVLSPNSLEFLRAQQQMLSTPGAAVGGGSSHLYQRAGPNPLEAISPSAFINILQPAGGLHQANQNPLFQMSAPEQESPARMRAQRRLSLDRYYTGGAGPEPSTEDILAKFLLQQGRVDPRRGLEEQARLRQAEQQFGGTSGPLPAIPNPWKNRPLQEALDEFVGKPPQSMLSGMLPQESPAGARARAQGLAPSAGGGFGVGATGLMLPEGQQSEEGRTEMPGLSGAGKKRRTAQIPSRSGEETSAESAPQRKKARKPTPSSNPLQTRVPPAPTFTGGIPQPVVLPPADFGRRATAEPAPKKKGPVRATPAPPTGPEGPQPSVGYGSVHLPTRSIETQEEVIPETHIKTTRAKRGQATDPHSIAERLRREKISERMRQLAALIPHRSNDKVTMLGDIVEYIKFMQLQVHVLALGKDPTGPFVNVLPAGLPTIATGPAEGPPPVQDAAVAQELCARLETGPAGAVQFLLDRGLCLMPAPLAARVVGQTGQMPEEQVPASAAQTTSGTAGQDRSASVASSAPGVTSATQAGQAEQEAPSRTARGDDKDRPEGATGQSGGQGGAGPR